MQHDDTTPGKDILDTDKDLENNISDSPTPEVDSTPLGSESLSAELQKALQERQEYLDGWLRLKADVANLKKNELSRLTWAEAAGKESVFEAVLPALDGFEMAIKSPAWQAVDPAWRTGMEGVYGQLQSALTQAGAQKFGIIGEHFDPTVHEPVATEETDDATLDATVTQVLATGWKLGEKILRPARVKIAHLKN